MVCGGDASGHAQLAQVARVAHPHHLASLPGPFGGREVEREGVRGATSTHHLQPKHALGH